MHPLSLCSAVLLSLMLASTGARAGEFRVMTFNIRYANPRDGLNVWPNRRDAAAATIAAQADMAGLQEVLPAQRQDLAERLPEFGYVGVGREPDDQGEGSPIFYRKERFTPLGTGTFWLADTPEVPGTKAWGANLPRICTWARFRDTKDGAVFYMFNTHLDHQSQEARARSIPLIRQRMEARESKDPAFLTGDFNMHPENPAFAHIDLLSAYEALGVSPEGTFHGFSEKVQPGAIDFIFVEKNRWKVQSCTVLKTKYTATDGIERYVSDHFPVAAVLVPQP